MHAFRRAVRKVPEAVHVNADEVLQDSWMQLHTAICISVAQPARSENVARCQKCLAYKQRHLGGAPPRRAHAGWCASCRATPSPVCGRLTTMPPAACRPPPAVRCPPRVDVERGSLIHTMCPQTLHGFPAPVGFALHTYIPCTITSFFITCFIPCGQRTAGGGRQAAGGIVVNRPHTGLGVARHDAHQPACARRGGAPPRRRCL
jgi:hypothetical protein